MGELALYHSLQDANFQRGSIRDLSVETRFFRPQMDTLPSFMAGMGRVQDRDLWMSVNGREEYWYRHEPGYANGEFRILKIGAHPDDTGLDSGAAFLSVNLGRIDGMKRTRLAVITATQGQKGTRPESLKGPLGKERIKEDVAGTNLLGADFYANLGFMDGEVSDDEALLVNRLTHYLSVLRPHAVLLADPEDPVHEDHKAVTRAAIQAIINNKMNPIVVYKEFQNGNRELTRDHVAYRLSLDEYEIVRKAFFIHETQTADLSDDIRELVGRPFRNAEVFGFDVPIGVFRQDPRFSQVSFGNYLGDRVIPLPEAEHDLRIFNERIRGYLPRTANNAQVIFDADETS